MEKLGFFRKQLVLLLLFFSSILTSLGCAYRVDQGGYEIRSAIPLPVRYSDYLDRYQRGQR